MDTPRYKTIISVLNSSNEGFDEYIEMSKRISLFVETDGASEANGMMEESYVASIPYFRTYFINRRWKRKRTNRVDAVRQDRLAERRCL